MTAHRVQAATVRGAGAQGCPKPAAVAYLKVRCAPHPGLLVSGPAPAALWLQQPAGAGRLLHNVSLADVPSDHRHALPIRRGEDLVSAGW